MADDDDSNVISLEAWKRRPPPGSVTPNFYACVRVDVGEMLPEQMRAPVVLLGNSRIGNGWALTPRQAVELAEALQALAMVAHAFAGEEDE